MVEIAKVFCGWRGGWCWLNWNDHVQLTGADSFSDMFTPIRCAPLAVIWICLKIGYPQIYRFIIVFLIFFLLNCHIYIYAIYLWHVGTLHSSDTPWSSCNRRPETDLPSCWVPDDCYPVCCVPGDGAGLNEDTDVFFLFAERRAKFSDPHTYTEDGPYN